MDSKAHDSGFYEQKFVVFQNLNYLTCSEKSYNLFFLPCIYWYCPHNTSTLDTCPVGGYNVCIIEVFGLDTNIYGLRRSQGHKLGE